MSTKHERAIEAAVRAVMETDMPFSRGVGGLGAVLPTAIDAYQRVMREPGPDEVRVRVAVLVAPEGNWSAAGGSDMGDEWAVERAEARLMDANQVRWIEANVPAWAPPAEATVEGEVAP